ncbi:hypothetical protein M409DRAFT_70621 [Zasmidium cellare ATCC 36951]|uniref:SMP-LTD domain-containing protein n=1 Tax=Zasmidium cellare ATCC 36951 TaxID=1080233 RepID=A0A6A6C3G7_ZASCE|nr:uncharacterized protein M409DRAFT_70621 [Zasmidium cellare ATCC 36951]KAF2160289.1 hypothetical protein M409DRAFT_70621 [Zasmidium cellare ATCC 36951]
MSFRTLAITYLVGGLTFLPLVLAAVLASAWYLLLKADHAEERQRDGPDDGKVYTAEEVVKEQDQSRSRQESTSDVGASGTFAVLRKYDFQAAIQALNARQNGSAAAGGQGHDTTAGDGVGNSSESVYQSMYRSVFSGNKNTGSSTSILDHDDTQQAPANRRRSVSANVMYIVLRHGHLMLYDSPAPMEVRHVLSLAHHNVTLQSGKEAEDEIDDRKIPEADLFIKRTAIVLTPVELPNGSMQSSGSQKATKPIYLFSATSFEKEDFFHALLWTRSHPPTLLPLDPEALIKLQSSLHSSSLTPETRALNALLGRVFLGIHHTDYLKNFILGKIEKKLARIQKPTFIPLLQIRSLDLGDAAPVFTNLKLRDLNINGDTTISADMRYNGGLSITLLAVAKLDLGPRFKARTVDLVLKASMQRVQGTMLLHIKPPPSNRLWYCFENMPELEVRAEPVVSERKITYGFVLRAIEERVRTALGEGLVKPNWDDVPMPLIDTRGSHARGGLWSDEGEDEHPELRPGSARVLSDRNDKTMSMPSFPPAMDSGASTGLSSNSEVNIARMHHSATMPVDERQVKRRPVGSSQNTHDPSSSPEISQQSSLPPKPLRSPSITLPSPVVAVDGQTVEQVRADDPSLQNLPSQNRRLWRSRGSIPQQQQQKDAMDELRDLRARADQAAARPSVSTTAEGADNVNRSLEELPGSHDSDEASIRSHQLSDSTIPATPRSFSIRSTDSERSTATSLSSARGQQPGQRKANLLAAAGAATTAARNWGWNTIQKNRGMLPRTGAKQEASPQSTSQPMGRGQPLPPPGQPLPGPNKGLWGGVSSMRRKPVPALPPRRPRPGESDSNSTTPNSKIPVLFRTKSGSSQIAGNGGDDEFGTWQENVVDDGMGPSGGSSESVNFDPSAEYQQSTHGHSSASITEDEDLLQLSAGEAEPETPRTKQPDEEQERSVDDTPSKVKKIPPPLPVRRQHSRREQLIENLSSPQQHDEDQSHNAKDADEDASSDAPGLRVPEGAADAIAAENSTVELESGANDDPEHLDDSNAVEAKVKAERTEAATHVQREQLSEGSDVGTNKEVTGLGRANTAERFLQGDDLTEEDFEAQDSTPSDEGKRSIMETPVLGTRVGGSRETETGTDETDEISQRIKAQVQNSRKSKDSSTEHNC